MIGRLTTGNNGFGWLAVIGRRRVPSPPAITTALIAGSPRARNVGGRGGRLAPPLHVGHRSIFFVVLQKAPSLYGVQSPGPPVQSGSPDREGPTDPPRDGLAGSAAVAEQQERKRVEHAHRGGLAEDVHRRRAVAVSP